MANDDKLTTLSDLKAAYDILDGKIGDGLSSFSISLVGNDLGWEDIYNVLKDVPEKSPRVFYAEGCTSLLTNAETSSTLKGYVTNNGSGTYDFFAMVGAGSKCFSWRIIGLTSSSATPTVNSVVKYENLSPKDARDEISAATKISLLSTDTTPAGIYAKLSIIDNFEPAQIYIHTDVMRVLTGKSDSDIVTSYGTVIRNSATDFRFMVAKVSGNYIHAFRTTVSESEITPVNVYRYSGTAL